MEIRMDDLAGQILRSPDGEVIYWNCFLEQTSIFDKIYELEPELVKISLKKLSKPFTQISDFEARSLKTGEISHLYHSPLNIYLYNDKESCIKAFNDLVYECLEQSKQEREKVIKQLDRRIDRLERSFINSDYVVEKLIRS